MSTTELPRPAESLQEQLQRQRAEQQDTTIEKLPIPGFGGRLIGCYRLLDWKAQRRIAARNAKVRGKDKEDTEALQELYNAADTLIASCEQIEVRTPKDADEQTKTEAAKFNAEGHKLNVAFAEYLGRHKADEERILDRGAVFLIIPQQTQVVVHAGLLMKAQGTVDEEIDEEQLGESDAAS